MAPQWAQRRGGLPRQRDSCTDSEGHGPSPTMPMEHRRRCAALVMRRRRVRILSSAPCVSGVLWKAHSVEARKGRVRFPGDTPSITSHLVVGARLIREYSKVRFLGDGPSVNNSVWSECLSYKEVAGGSNPSSRTVGEAEVAEAPGCDPGGSGCKSRLSPQRRKAMVANAPHKG